MNHNNKNLLINKKQSQFYLLKNRQAETQKRVCVFAMQIKVHKRWDKLICKNTNIWCAGVTRVQMLRQHMKW